MDPKDQSHMYAHSGVTLPNKKINSHPQLFPRKTEKKSTLNLVFEEKNSFSTSVSKSSCCRQAQIQIHHNDQNYC
jgi:hypothetical protein